MNEDDNKKKNNQVIFKLPSGMKDNTNQSEDFLNNADIRAGRIPGWPNKPETNGDPFDPDNMERTDAAMEITEGMVMRNVATAHAAKHVGQRRIFLLALTIPFLLVFGYPMLKGYVPESIMGSIPAMPFGFSDPSQSSGYSSRRESERSSEKEQPATEGQITLDFLNDKYASIPSIAGTYDLSFMRENMGWPERVIKNVSFDESILKIFTEKYTVGGEDEQKLMKNIDDSCLDIDEQACIDGIIRSEVKFVYMQEKGHDMALYQKNVNFYDTNKKQEKLESVLADFLVKFPKTAATYCDSNNRKYADMITSTDANELINGIRDEWVEGKTDLLTGHPKSVKVKDLESLMAHRAKGDEACNNAVITYIKVGTGALEYIVSVAARTHSDKGNNIGVQQFFLISLDGDKGQHMLPMACKNCSAIPALDENAATRNARTYLPELTKSAKPLVKLIKQYEKNNKNNTNEEN